MSAIDWAAIERELLGALDGAPFAREPCVAFARALALGRSGPEANRLSCTPEPCTLADVDSLEALDTRERARLEARGRDAWARGEAACCVLNGGMATRFGGLVKGVVPAVRGRSFLEIKLAQARGAGPEPCWVMNSFATGRATWEQLRERGLATQARPFVQSASLRWTREGVPFRDASGRLSPCATGHGDLPDALRRSGALRELCARGVRTLFVSNVDNLGARPDPLVLGYHRTRGRPITAEVTCARAGDRGGILARVEGRSQLVEPLRLPAEMDLERVALVNTNSLWIELDALASEVPLAWYSVEKQVEGRVAVQMERIVGELTRFIDASFLCVRRDRYLPVKRPADLERLRVDRLDPTWRF
ncbi:MAG: UTP--glucose-1-phosphate uridylyltransferase [Myxococcota bacterium]